MERTTMRGRSAEALYEVLSLSLENVGIKSLACFGTCSKGCMELSKSICQQHTRQLLPPLVKLATLTSLGAKGTADKAVAAIDWVVACAGAAALAGLADALLAIPRVPQGIANKLADCGVCLSWEQLKAAAKSRIAGIEVFGVGPLMPPMVVAVCKREQLTSDEQWLRTPASDIPELLHLALNKRKPEAARELLQLLQEECCTAEPVQQMQQLRSFHLQTEAQSACRIILQQLKVYQQRGWSLPPLLWRYKRQQHQMQQALDAVQQRHQQERQQLRDRPKQLKQLLTTDLVVELLHTAALRGHWAVMGQLFELDAAQSITADVAAELLHAAVQARSVVGLEVIIKHQAAQRLSADALCSLMQSAVQTAFSGTCSPLLQLPAAAAINAADVFQLLRQGTEMRDAVAVHKICKLSSASALSAEQIVALLQHAFTRNVSDLVEPLTELPGALLIPIGSVVLLLQTAMQQGDIKAVEELVRMDVVNQLDAQQLCQLCKSAMAVSANSASLDLLLQLPAADDLDDSQVSDLLRAALQQSKRDPFYCRSRFDCLEAVVQLPAAHNLPASLLCECLEELVHVSGTDDLIEKLCFGLDSAHGEYGSFGCNNGLSSAILTALLLQRVAAAKSMSELTDFNDVSSEVLQDLLTAAIEEKQEYLAIKLCHSSAARKLTCSALVRMLRVATRQRLCNVVESLLVVLDAIAYLCADQLAGLIKEELNAVDSCTQHTVPCILNKYVAYNAATPIHWSQIAELMCLAIQKRKHPVVVQLCKLSGAQDANAWPLVDSVLHIALQKSDAWLHPSPLESLVFAVCRLPAAHHMNALMLKSLMEAAVRGGGTDLLQQLCQLPSAAELGANVVLDLVVIALHCGAANMAAILSTLPGAALFSRQDLMHVLQTAIATDDICVYVMLGCEVDGSVPSRFGSSKLGAAEKLLTEDVAALLLMCLQDREFEQAAVAIEALGKLPAAEHLCSDHLSSLLQTAIQLDLDSELQSLCLLHKKVLGSMTDELICKLIDVADTCTPKCSAEVLEILSELHTQQQLSGFVCGFY